MLPKIKLSCLPVSLFGAIQQEQLSIREWAYEAKSAGLDGIDLGIALIKNHTPAYLEKIKKELEEESIPVIMITAYPDFTHPDKLQREREKDYFIRDIALASYLGAKYLRITAGQAHPETGIKEGINFAAEAFREMDSIADKYNIRLLYENHTKPGAWRLPDFSMPFEIFTEIAEKIKETGIRLNLDLGNLLVCGRDPIQVLDIMYPMVETIHASDMKQKGKFEPAAIGKGAVPYPEIMQYLKEKDFDKWICIEEASFSGLEGVREAVAFIKNLL